MGNFTELGIRSRSSEGSSSLATLRLASMTSSAPSIHRPVVGLDRCRVCAQLQSIGELCNRS